MSIQTALILILWCVAFWLYVQTRADKARRELVRLAAYEHWSNRTFRAVREILYIEGFPSDELTLIHRVVSIIDDKSSAASLFAVFNNKNRSYNVMNGANKEFFDSNKMANDAYMEFFYSSLMTISFLDGWGDLVRPKIEEMINPSRHNAMEISEDVREVHWPSVVGQAA